MAAQSPTTSSVQIPANRSRRGSLESLGSKKNFDRELLSNALDEIHTNASRSDTLTTFAEFASPPRASNTDPKGLAGELVQGGLSGLYNRLKASVGVVSKDAVVQPASSGATDSADDASIDSGKTRTGPKTPKSAAGTLVSSPVIISAPSSRLQSPLATQFPESQPSTARPPESSSASTTSRTSGQVPKSPSAGHFSATNIKDSAEGEAPQGRKPDNTNNKSRSTSISEIGLKSSSKASSTHISKDSSSASTEYTAEQRDISLADIDEHSQSRTSQAPFVSPDPHELESALDGIESLDDATAVLIEDPNDDNIQTPTMENEPPMMSRQPSWNAKPLDRLPSLRIETVMQTTGVMSLPPGEESAAARPPLMKISQSHLPGYRPSRATSSDGDLSSVTTVAASKQSAYRDPLQIPSRVVERKELPSDGTLPQTRRQLLGKEFWMRDENAKDCFNCGDSFSTFRRKHHCRTCGQIFDSKCTSLIPGSLFGQSGSVRVCKSCESIINGTEDDDSSVYSDEEALSVGSPGDMPRRGSMNLDGEVVSMESDHTKIGTPVMGIPISRRTGETKRRSAVIEFDNQPILARPSSSRSLRSLSGRPHSSGHKRHHSRHQHMRSLKSSHEERAPFHRRGLDEPTAQGALAAFHHDNIIDPDLAPFLSDDGSSGEEQPSIFATMSGDGSQSGKDAEKGGLSGLLAAVRKGKSRGEPSVAGMSAHGRDTDNMSLSNRRLHRHARHGNLSVSSVSQNRLSPRRSKSNGLLKGFIMSPAPSPHVQPDTGSPAASTRSNSSKLIRSSSLRGQTALAAELNKASERHVKRLLKQMLEDARLEHVRHWRRALMPILLQCTDDVSPDIHRDDDMDIRHYVKLKKIPGGKPGDTSYVSGVVFSKNVALKSMPRSVANPRIAIVTFAIEYARHQQHFMSLQPVIAQEQEYLKNLVKRIVALGPQVLLVEKNVSGLALQFLDESKVTVISNVKRSVLNAVSRCTQAQLITSVDKLAIDPSQLGRCSGFDVKTYVHRGVKKSYVYLSGCAPDLGCTIVLRGAEESTLRKIKRITEFMCFVVYNLKLETCLMRDEFVEIPETTDDITLFPVKDKGLKAVDDDDDHPRPTSSADVVNQASQKLQELAEKDFAVSNGAEESKAEESKNTSTTDLEEHTAVASNATKTATTPKSIMSSMEDIHVPDDIPMPTYYGDMVGKYQTKILSASPFVKYAQPYLLIQAREQERKLAYLKRLRDQYAPPSNEEKEEDSSTEFELVKPEMMHKVIERPSKQVREFLYAVHNSEYEKALHNYQTQKRQWEGYISGNTTLFDPFAHQRIAVLYSLVNTTTSTPCVGPEIVGLAYYAEHVDDDGFTSDITLGDYIERLCLTANEPCDTNGCDKKLLDHHQQYVHGEGQMNIIVQKHPARFKNMHNTILMWSVCRKCGHETKTIPLSPNSWKYSFAKYLELTFWSSELHPRGGNCIHDIHKDHARYFGFNNMAVRIQYDPVQLYEVVVPRPTIAWKVASDLNLKNELFLKIEAALDKFMITVKARIKSINVESVAPELLEACKAEIERMFKRAVEDHDLLTVKLREKYLQSKYYEIIPLNRAVRFIQEKTFAWDDAFADFERNYFPSEKDIRRLATLQLKKLFLDRDESSTTISSIEERDEDQATENSGESSQIEIKTLHRQPSSLSKQEADEVLTSVIEEQRASKSDIDTAENESAVSSTLGPSMQSSESRQQAASASVEMTPTVVERDDVKHLDLAVSQDLREAANAQDTLKATQPLKRPSLAASGIPTASTIQTIADPNESLAELECGPISPSRPYYPRVATAAPGNIPEISESKIPRPIGAGKQDGQPIAPPLNRAQSGPAVPLRRDVGALVQSPTPPTNAPAKVDGPRPSMPEAAKALEKRMSERLMGSFKLPRNASHSMIPRSVPSKRNDTRVSTLAKHFEQLSREFEKERLRERRQRAARNRQSRAYPLASSKPIVEVYRDAHEAVRERDTEEEPPGSPPMRTSTDVSTLEDSSFVDTTAPTSIESHSLHESNRSAEDLGVRENDAVDESGERPTHASDVEGEHSDVDHGTMDDGELPEGIEGQSVMSPSDSQMDLSIELPKHEKTSLVRMLTSFWSERSSSGWTPLEYPFGSNEHVWEDSDIIVREDEPTSIIALALSCPDYLQKMEQFRNIPINDDKDSIMEDSPPQSYEDASIERNLLYQKNTNIRYAFQKHGVRAQCKIFYAESFDALRRKCGVAERFVESLSRCLKYDSKGGKSKSLFLKTLDDRFVVKSLSPVEVNAFFKFAPNYFSFMHHNLFKGLLSVIAKMVGLFQVTIKTSASGVEYNWFMLVMENLFYDRQPNRRFDLKGSMRNRKIQSTGESDEVLLDENLVDIIFERPIFVREHSKKLLKASVWNDTLFLSKQNVMDYSLMAGFDDLKQDIIVGIIGKHRPGTTSFFLSSLPPFSLRSFEPHVVFTFAVSAIRLR